jgi:hypothetical protein
MFIARYSLIRTDDRYDDLEMVALENGEYVRFEDIEHILEEFNLIKSNAKKID